jgi:ABC-type sugar transport system permease subunit
MTGALAAIRPDDWNFPLLVHVLGAMILFGGLITGASALAFARGQDASLRLGYWTLLTVALPGWVIMFAGAQWIYSKEGWDEEGVDEPFWLSLGMGIAFLGAVLLIAGLIVGGIGLYRMRQGKSGAGLLRVTMILAVLIIAAALVAVWAMAGKPD